MTHEHSWIEIAYDAWFCACGAERRRNRDELEVRVSGHIVSVEAMVAVWDDEDPWEHLMADDDPEDEKP